MTRKSTRLGTPPTTTAKSVLFSIPSSSQRSATKTTPLLTLPKILANHHRASTPSHDPLIHAQVVEVDAVFELAGNGRSVQGQPVQQGIQPQQLLALEAQDGSTLIVRADKLHADLKRLYGLQPDQGDMVDLSVLRDREAQARGLGDWIWSRLSVLNLLPDGVVAAAKDKAIELLKEKLKDTLHDQSLGKLEDLAYGGASWAGATALMWAIESKLEGEPGLYHWQAESLQPSDRVLANDPTLANAANNQEPILLFIHGTASSTSGSFGSLRFGEDEARWANLTRPFGKRVYGFEHRTLSESPLENALQLAETLPAGGRLSLVTHSRGGLIGDLLCLADFDDNLIQRYQRLPVKPEGEDEEPELHRKLREQIIADEHAQLRKLRDLLKHKQFKIERYVRIACPAAGTTLLADNLDLFLSGLLSLTQFAVSVVPVVGSVGSMALSVLRRVVLEMADKRIDPRLVPGLEAMLPQSPLTQLLGQALRRDGIKMAIIAGHASGEGGCLLRRIAIMLSDWIIFGRSEHDFVVDTLSMRAGLVRRNTSYEHYAYGSQVSHVHYFQRPETRLALHRWLNHPQPETLALFSKILTDCDVKLDAKPKPNSKPNNKPTTQRSQGKPSALPAGAPIVFYLPGMMGSHLEILKPGQGKSEGDRVWFDPFHLAAGGIDQINISKRNIQPEGMLQRYYGGLQVYLEQSCEVIPFAYDWRQPLEQSAAALSAALQAKLEQLSAAKQHFRPVSILAHSMGGLVVRAMLLTESGKQHWQVIAQRPHSHFVMLGTPNHGSYLMVENLLGRGSAIRQLAMADIHHDLQEILEIISGFGGVLNLLPPDGYTDQDVPIPLERQGKLLNGSYFASQTWEKLGSLNTPVRWFAPQKRPNPPPVATLQAAKTLWDSLQQQETNFPHPERVAYVFGVDAHTPCALAEQEGALQAYATVKGDGSVTWQSGRLACLDEKQYWYMPVAHAALTNDARHFKAIAELLRFGKTDLLPQTPPRTRSSATPTYRYGIGPVLQPGAEDLALSFFGGHPQRVAVVDPTQTVQVSVRAMDLRFASHPLLCGHYQADAIAGAERQLDCLLGDALSQRERLGIYAGAIGTSTIVLSPRSKEDHLRGTGKGALIVGLGDWNQINAQRITETVRDGVLAYLLQASINDTAAAHVTHTEEAASPISLTLNSLLIGYNSTTHISVEASIEAIVRGVCEANQQYRYNPSKGQAIRYIGKLEFIEFYLDTAITAAYSVRDLPQRLEKDLEKLEARLAPAPELHAQRGQGMRHRLTDRSAGSGYWPRLMVTDADGGDDSCPAHCYQTEKRSPIPKAVMDAVKRQLNVREPEVPPLEESTTVPAERLKYVFLSERARAEALIHQRQPGLVEALIKEAMRTSQERPELNRTLFQLMVPLDFKSAARQTDRLLLVLDGYTANLPWEMLQADDEPLALKMAVVRQLVSTRYRRKVITTLGKTACVIGNPSTEGFFLHFPSLDPNPSDLAGDKCLPSLSGAVQEAQEVIQTLQAAGYDVTPCLPSSAEGQPTQNALEVLNTLFKKPYRILMIAAHGEANLRGRDGKHRTGVVLSDGVMLTAAEVGQMEEVPDLVFLNCCHLAKDTTTISPAYNRLAYSLARELIEMGVRCVVAAGWAVDDAAAQTFSTQFFRLFVDGHYPFGKAVWEARKLTRALHPGTNTWGAYQAYGDPSYILDPHQDSNPSSAKRPLISAHELQDYLSTLSLQMHNRERRYEFQELQADLEAALARTPTAWVHEPGIQYLLASLYREVLPQGFEAARTAYQTAIQLEDRSGSVPIVALEQLANLEARQAEALAQQIPMGVDGTPDTAAFAEAEALVGMAIQRMEKLIDLTAQTNATSLAFMPANASNSQANTERYAILGSAYKRQAMIRLQAGQTPEQVREALEKSHDAYAKGENLSYNAQFHPYALINRLQLAGILQPAPEGWETLLDRAQAIARQRFTSSYDFFDAVMTADAEVARFLLDGSNTPKEVLLHHYHDAIRDIAHTTRNMESVMSQLRCLACLLEKTDSPQGLATEKAWVLREVAAELGGFSENPP